MVFQNISNYLIWRWRFRKLHLKEQIEIEIANTLIIETLENFKEKTQWMEKKIHNRSPLDRDILSLRKHIQDIDRIVRLLRLRRFQMKNEIKKLKSFTKILDSTPFHER